MASHRERNSYCAGDTDREPSIEPPFTKQKGFWRDRVAINASFLRNSFCELGPRTLRSSVIEWQRLLECRVNVTSRDPVRRRGVIQLHSELPFHFRNGGDLVTIATKAQTARR
jgi:hypothetical protein